MWLWIPFFTTLLCAVNSDRFFKQVSLIQSGNSSCGKRIEIRTSFPNMYYAPIAKYSEIRLTIIAYENRTLNYHDEYCEITSEDVHNMCGVIRKWNISSYMQIDIICNEEGYQLHVPHATETLLNCNGQVVNVLVIEDCAFGWTELDNLAGIFGPHSIFLGDVPLTNISDTDVNVMALFTTI